MAKQAMLICLHFSCFCQVVCHSDNKTNIRLSLACVCLCVFFVCMCVCVVLLHVSELVGTLACVYTCRCQWKALGVFLYHSLPYCFETGSLTELEAHCFS